MKRKGMQVMLVAVAVLAMVGIAHADTVTFTGIGTTSGGSVSAKAVVTTSGSTITVTLTNLTGTISDIAQELSDFTFSLNSTPSGASFTGTATAAGKVDCTGLTFPTPCVFTNTAQTSTSAFGWGVTLNGSTLTLSAGAGALKPNNVVNKNIVAGPSSNGDTSNSEHNPNLLGPVTFTITLTGVTGTPTINTNGASFSFGTGPETVAAIHVVPEPGTLALFGSGLLSIAALIRRRISS